MLNVPTQRSEIEWDQILMKPEQLRSPDSENVTEQSAVMRQKEEIW